MPGLVCVLVLLVCVHVCAVAIQPKRLPADPSSCRQASGVNRRGVRVRGKLCGLSQGVVSPKEGRAGLAQSLPSLLIEGGGGGGGG